MEPLDECHSGFSMLTLYQASALMLPVVILICHSTKSLRLRGAGSDSDNNKSNDIPALNKIRFEWNGLPQVDFMENVMFPLNNGLASVIDKGYSLLRTANRTDAGGLRGNPNRAGASPQQIEESDLRNERTFACILNYISVKSYVYKLFMRDFTNNGWAVFDFLPRFGRLTIPPKVRKARNDAWDRMTMEILKYPFNMTGYFSWVFLVMEQARVLGNKDGDMQKEKFIEGLPSFFDSVKTSMRQNTTCLFPATYGAIPAFANSPIATRAHPLNGQPDILKLATLYMNEFVARAAQATKQPVEGLANIANLIVDDDHELHANLLHAKDVTPSMVCTHCDERGHPASCILEDGTRWQCPKRVFHQSPVVKKDKKAMKMQKDIAALTEQINAMQAHLDDFNVNDDTSQHSNDTSHDNNSTTFATELSQASEDDDQASQSSEGESLHSFADVHAASSSRRPFAKGRKFVPKKNIK